MMPLLSVGVVTAHVPNTHSVIVSLRATGQGITVPVKVPFHFAADALRVSQKALPGMGTWGVIAFPYGDDRNGVWLCSYFPSYMSSFNTQGDSLDPFLEYESHWSGFWSSLDGSGRTATQWPDGSYFLAGASSLPQPTRTVVSSGNVPTRQALTQAQRVPATPAAFPFRYRHASGAAINVTSAGSVSISGVSGQSITISLGQASVTLASGALTLACGATILQLTPSGINIVGETTATGEGTFNGIDVSIHYHGGVTTGGGNTGGPVG